MASSTKFLSSVLKPRQQPYIRREGAVQLRQALSVYPDSRRCSSNHSPAISSLTQRRYKSMQTSTGSEGSEKTGHIDAAQNEAVFFLDNVFPLRLNILLQLPFRNLVNTHRAIPELMARFNSPEDSAAHPSAIAQRATPSSLNVTITETLPRIGEGGTFVKFRYSQDQDRKEIARQIEDHLKKNPIKPWFNPFKPARASLVKGVPWLEDLHRLPSPKLKVEFLPSKPGAPFEEVSEEALYTLLRKYGKIVDILPQPKDSKEVPRYAHVYFNWIRHAIMAKNCLHGYTVPPDEGGGASGAILRLTYARKRKGRMFWDWLVNHPRITFPLLAALFGTAAVAIFDPIRTFSIKAHVTRSFHITDNRIYKWFMSQATRANEILNLRRKRNDDAGLRAIWEDRKESIENLNTWLMESADTFIVIQGPRGSGKKEFVFDQGLKGRKNTVVIDCKAIQEARGDSATIRAAAVQVGYRPIFSWMNSISSMIDLAAQGTIGTKTGFSETVDTQLQKIWQNTSTALRKIALDGRRKDDKDASLGEDEYLEAHPEKRPVVVIDNFLHKSQESSVVYDKLSEWAANLTTANVAHVVFLTTDVSFSKSLSKALPDRVFRQISLGDCSPEVAKQFVINHLDATDAAEDSGKSEAEKNAPPLSQSRTDLGELDSCISTLGGRLTDLEFLARRIKSGETPRKAVEEIKRQSADEILKMYILDVDSTNGRGWTPQQAWLVIKALAESESLKYNDFITNSSGSETSLRALQQAELITIVSANGRPSCIKPGKPVYTAAFKMLTGDKVLKAQMDLKGLAEETKKESDDIKKWEDELKVLGEIPGSGAETAGRVRYLLGKLRVSQGKVEEMDKESSRLKGVLKEEY